VSVPFGNELLAALPQDELEALKPLLRRTELPEGKLLHYTGEPVNHVYFLDSGAAALVVEMRAGETIQTALVGRDGTIGGNAALHNAPALNKAFIQIAGSAHVMAASQLRQFCAVHRTLADLIALENDFLQAQAQQSSACNAVHSLEARLSRWLLRAHELCGPQFSLTQEQLAAFLGVRRTSVSLTAHALHERGIIRYRRGHMHIVYLERLTRGACECHEMLHAQKARLQGDGSSRPMPAAAPAHAAGESRRV
jgi:CRP-like cAMP-binding protein